jgi:hypothetical protein
VHVPDISRAEAVLAVKRPDKRVERLGERVSLKTIHLPLLSNAEEFFSTRPSEPGSNCPSGSDEAS